VRILLGRDEVPTRLVVRLLWEPRDLWVGAFWNRLPDNGLLLIYVCLLPCLPFVICIPHKERVK
jgi:hypothetical protein